MGALASVREVDDECRGLLPRLRGLEQRPAVYHASGDVLWTRAALRSEVQSMAKQLISKQPQLTFLIGKNEPACLVALLATLAARNPIALIDHAAPAATVARLMRLYAPDLVIGPPARLSAVGLVSHNFPLESDVSIWRTPNKSTIEIAENLALLLSTSGTTGSPKFVRLSERNLLINADQIAVALNIMPNHIAVAHLPLHYSYGLSVVTSHLKVGAAVHLWSGTVTVPEFWAAVARSGGTHFPGVPYHYNFIGRGDLRKIAPPSLRTFTQAGGSLDTRIQQRMLERLGDVGGRLFIMYGQTEASPRMATLPAERLAEKIGSVGKALIGGAISIIDETDKVVEVGQSGRVVYEGPNVMLGYADARDDLGLPDQMGGRLVTGDLGRLDDEGYLFLTGREKRFAKLYGLRINLDEVEARLRGAGVVAAIEQKEKIVLFTDRTEDVSTIIIEVANEYNIPASSFLVRVVDDLPLKSSGKIDYAQLNGMS